MKIAVAPSGHIPSQWAHSINVAKHAQAFAELGNDVEIITTLRFLEKKALKKNKSVTNFYGLDKLIKVKFFTDLFFYFKEAPIVKYFYYLFNKITFYKIYYLLNADKKIINYIIKNNFDIVYCRDFKLFYDLVKNDVPVILETHTPKIKNKYLKKALKLSDKDSFKGIVTISAKIKETFILADLPKEKIIVQEDAVDLKMFDRVKNNKKELCKKIGLPIDKKIIMYSGSLRPGKGISSLIKVAQLTKDDNVLFYVIGGPENRKIKFEKFCKQNNITNIYFKGFIKNNLIPLYLKSADILIMLYSLKEKNMVMDLETTSPIKLFEYMASKKPIICSNINSIKKIVKNKEEVLFVEIDKEKEIASKIKMLQINKKLANNLSLKSYDLAQQYTYQKRCLKILELL